MIIYMYENKKYDTEEEAQAAVTAYKNRLENNPTDWCCVKPIEQNKDGSWLITPVHLTDSEINNIDTTKTYLIYSVHGSGHEMPVIADQVKEKVLEYRTEYVLHKRLDVIHKLDGEYDEFGDFEGTIEIFTPNEDMSGYI